jgi:HrpA-like RNA helicase
MEHVNKFFDIQGRGPNQKMRGKKLRVEVGHDESVHFLEAGDNFVVEYAKPVLFSDTAALKALIQLVDKANRSLGADDSLKGSEENLPSIIFNDNWRRTKVDLRKRLDQDSVDPIYCERRDNLRKRLPAFEVGNQFCNMVFSNDVVVLCGATGCGKTTVRLDLVFDSTLPLHYRLFLIFSMLDSNYHKY